jgi:hypothetical protein
MEVETPTLLVYQLTAKVSQELREGAGDIAAQINAIAPTVKVRDGARGGGGGV